MALPFDVIVSTCAGYSDTTVPVLMASMREAGVPMESVHVVRGQCIEPTSTDEGEGDDRGHERHECGYTAEALTGLVFAAENPGIFEKEWVLLIQDTMVVGRDFVARATAAFESVACRGASDSAGVLCVKLLDRFSLSVGFYRMPWVRSLDLAPIKHVDTDEHAVRGVKMFIEDWVFDRCPRTACLGRYDDANDRRVVGRVRYTAYGPERLVEHYPSLDVYKLKSWYGQADKVGSYVDPRGIVRIKIPVGV